MSMEIYREVCCAKQGSKWRTGDVLEWVRGGVYFFIPSAPYRCSIGLQSPNAWRFTGFYGSPTVEGKATAWSILRTLRTHHNLPWLCAGDFNELLSGSEKWGRRPRPEHQMSQFCQVIDDCGFMDLGFTGPAYTWCNNQTGDSRVLERLDRSLATTDWLLRFPNCHIHHLHMVFSDHSLLWMELNQSVRTPRPRQRQFRFEEMWIMDARCEDTIQQA